MGIPSVTIPPARSAFNHTDQAGAEKESLQTLSPAGVWIPLAEEVAIVQQLLERG
jgi:hypothetical protein